MNDLELDKRYKRGTRGEKVKLIQEWLSLHGFHVQLDGDFGPATESAVKGFQSRSKLPVTGIVDDKTFGGLVAPMRAALEKIPPGNMSLGQMTLAYAEQHLKQHPREVGGQNCGPWVRMYMNGLEGGSWPWCAGFVCFCLKQACDSLGTAMPIKASFSCDSLAAFAQQQGRFVKEPAPSSRSKITPGSLFLVRRTDTDWTHTGIVASIDKDVFRTIEGNTNENGVREGFEVCSRFRAYTSKDFVVI